MAAASVSCVNCGAGDVQEVKPNTYFCNYCEQVFKWVDPVRGTGFGLGQCECGMLAVATCTGCGRVLCTDHVRRLPNGSKVFCPEEAAVLIKQAARQAAIDRREAQYGKFQEAVMVYEQTVRKLADLAARRNDVTERVLLIAAGPALPSLCFSFYSRQSEEVNDRLAKEVRAKLFGTQLPDYIDAHSAKWEEWRIRSDRLAEWLKAKCPSGWSTKIRVSRTSYPVFHLPESGPYWERSRELLLPDGRIATGLAGGVRAPEMIPAVSLFSLESVRSVLGYPTPPWFKQVEDAFQRVPWSFTNLPGSPFYDTSI